MAGPFIIEPRYVKRRYMKKLEERILQDGNVLGENILKVDSFLTHQVDLLSISVMQALQKL